MCLSLQLHFQLIAKKLHYISVFLLKNSFDMLIRPFLKIHEFLLKNRESV